MSSGGGARKAYARSNEGESRGGTSAGAYPAPRRSPRHRLQTEALAHDPASGLRSDHRKRFAERTVREFFADLPDDERHYWIASLYALLMPKARRKRLAAYFTPPHLAHHAFRVLRSHIPYWGTEKSIRASRVFCCGLQFRGMVGVYDKELYEVQLEAIIRKGDYQDQLCKAKDALLEAYGQPKVSNLIPDKPIYTWITADTQVTYLGGPLGNGFREMGITYTKRDWWTTPHQKKRL